ncbi:MAG: hypothetical protein AAGC55_03350 [Myxococcota bacterium]
MITGFGLAVGRMLFDLLKERMMPEEAATEPQQVAVDDDDDEPGDSD